MERITAIVSGRVQGVMYRDFCCRNARSLGIGGYAQNLADGTVGVVAEGETDALKKFIAALGRGPFFAKVSSVSGATHPATGAFSSFAIRYE